MKPKKVNKQKDILFILISSFILVVLWIGFNLFHIWATSTISQDIQEKLTPISGNFDLQQIQQLKNRTQINPAYEKPLQEKQVVALSPTPSVIPPSASQSAQADQNQILRRGQ